MPGRVDHGVDRTARRGDSGRSRGRAEAGAWCALAVLALVLPAAAGEPADPTAEEQHFIYLINRARHDPRTYELERSLTVDLSGVTPQPPLAVNANLTGSARFHAEEMATYDYGDQPNKMARDFGYSLPSDYDDADNNIESLVAGTYVDAEDGLEMLIVDEGIVPPGHRIHLLAMDPFWEDHREIGVGHAYNASSEYGNYWAIHTACVSPSDTFLTGVVFDDLDDDLRYDAGEGLGGVAVTAGAYSTTTNPAGGWSAKVPGGTYEVSASGGAFSGTSTAWCLVAGANVEVDFISGFPSGLVDFETSEDADADGMDDFWELNHFGDISHDGFADGDSDDLTDLEEFDLGTDPTDADTDGDGLTDGEEADGTPATDPLKADTDGDGLSDYQELNVRFTDPTKPDTDGDGLSDGAEVTTHSTDPNEPDSDGDGLSDGLEVNRYSSDPNLRDTDGDGLEDGEEVNTYSTDPTKPDTDGDGLEDYDEVTTHLTDPTRADTDGDGLTDGEEVNGTPATDPCDTDSDDDGLSDYFEVRYAFDPLSNDTDGNGTLDPDEDPDEDGHTNLEEYHGRSDPLDPNSVPREDEGIFSCSGRAGPGAGGPGGAALMLAAALALAMSRIRSRSRT